MVIPELTGRQDVTSAIVASASRSGGHDESFARMAAAGGSALLLVLAGKLLGGLPRPAAADLAEGPRVQLVFSARPPDARPAMAPRPAPASTGSPMARPVQLPQQASASRPGPMTQDAAGPAPAAIDLYGPDGRLQLPASTSDRWTAPPAPPPGGVVTQGEDAGDAAARLLQRPNPVPSRETRFAKDWVSDGDLADVAAQEIARAQRKIAQFLFGGDITHATARPSPEVHFNPTRHERGADLGSEATGDAYKAAPISYVPAPGLDGEASRRIREQVGALEASYGHCDRARLRRLMQPLLLHLDELQKVEAAHARGADPVRAEHMLPNAANSAYDLARRALWHADRQMAGCGGG